MSDESKKKFSILPPSIDNAIRNLTDAPTKTLGQYFADCLYLKTAHKSREAAELRIKIETDIHQFNDSVINKIDSIPEEKRLTPSMQITAQALSDSIYCISSAELRDMFANLISGSVNSDLEPYIHPSFSSIIKQMSPDDAQILKEIPTLEFSVAPTVDYILTIPNSNLRRIYLRNVIFPRLCKLDMPQISRSMTALNYLGLVEFDKASQDSSKTNYNLFLQTDYYERESRILKMRYPEYNLRTKNYISYLTPLGLDFCRVCLR